MSKPIKNLIKSALALASLGIASSTTAATNVTLQGVADAYVGSIRYSGSPGRLNSVGNGGLTASWFGLSGQEKLGDNLTATFNLESFFQINTGVASRPRPNDTFFSRQATVGLKGRWGAIKLGRNNAPNFFPLLFSSPFGSSTTSSPLYMHAHMPVTASFGPPSWASAINGDAGWSNSVMYQTPSLSGLTATFLYQFSGAGDDNSKKNMGANLIYRNGPFMATAFVQKVELNNPDGLPFTAAIKKETTWFGSASYNFKWIKLFGSYQQAKRNTPGRDKTWQLGLSAPAAGGNILFSWAQTRRNTSLAKLKRDTASLGYDYFLSKRTDVYAIGMYDKVTNFKQGTSFLTGIRHRF